MPQSILCVPPGQIPTFAKQDIEFNHHDAFEIKQSLHSGQGVFTKRAIQKGEKLLNVWGRWANAAYRFRQRYTRNLYFLKIDEVFFFFFFLLFFFFLI